MLGADYRYVGAISEIVDGGVWGANHSGYLAGFSASDNELPTVIGSTARYYRTSTAGEDFPSNVAPQDLPASFFTLPSRQSSDIETDPVTGDFVVTHEGTYILNARIKLLGTVSTPSCLVLKVNGSVSSWGQMIYADSVGLSLNGSWSVYLLPGDTVSLATYQASGLPVVGVLGGEATGTQTFFDITLSYRPPPVAEAA